MRLTRSLAVLLLLGGVTVVAVQAGSAQEGGDVAELHFSPSEGPPGGAITIIGRCLYEGRPADSALVSLNKEPPTAESRVSVSIPVAADGSVNGKLVVPADATPGPYTVGGYCFKSDFTIGERSEAPFRVIGQPVTTTTTPPTSSTAAPEVTATEPNTTTTTTTTRTATPVAPAARARAGEPNFTG